MPFDTPAASAAASSAGAHQPPSQPSRHLSSGTASLLSRMHSTSGPGSPGSRKRATSATSKQRSPHGPTKPAAHAETPVDPLQKPLYPLINTLKHHNLSSETYLNESRILKQLESVNKIDIKLANTCFIVTCAWFLKIANCILPVDSEEYRKFNAGLKHFATTLNQEMSGLVGGILSHFFYMNHETEKYDKKLKTPLQNLFVAIHAYFLLKITAYHTAGIGLNHDQRNITLSHTENDVLNSDTCQILNTHAARIFLLLLGIQLSKDSFWCYTNTFNILFAESLPTFRASTYFQKVQQDILEPPIETVKLHPGMQNYIRALQDWEKSPYQPSPGFFSRISRSCHLTWLFRNIDTTTEQSTSEARSSASQLAKMSVPSASSLQEDPRTLEQGPPKMAGPAQKCQEFISNYLTTAPRY